MKWLEIKMKPSVVAGHPDESWWQARRPANRAERAVARAMSVFYMAEPSIAKGHLYGKVTRPHADREEGDRICRVTEREIPLCPGSNMKWDVTALPRCAYCHSEWPKMFVQRPVWHKRFRNAGKWTTRVPPHADWRLTTTEKYGSDMIQFVERGRPAE